MSFLDLSHHNIQFIDDFPGIKCNFLDLGAASTVDLYLLPLLSLPGVKCLLDVVETILNMTYKVNFKMLVYFTTNLIRLLFLELIALSLIPKKNYSSTIKAHLLLLPSILLSLETFLSIQVTPRTMRLFPLSAILSLPNCQAIFLLCTFQKSILRVLKNMQSMN